MADERRRAFVLRDEAPAVVYLNAASRTPLLRSAHEAGVRAVGAKLLPWHIDGYKHEHEDTRQLFGRLVGAERGNVALTPSCSYGITLAARCLHRAGRVPSGSDILVLEDQMSSNVYPWQRLARDAGATLRVVRRPADGDWTRAVCAQVGPRLSVAALPNVHWCDGSFLDLPTVGAACRAARGALVVDATQSLGALAFDQAVTRADFVMASAHKWLLGPYGVCPVYVAPEWQRAGLPLEEHEHSRLAPGAGRDLPFRVPMRAGQLPYAEAFVAGAGRMDSGGRPNPILLPMLNAGLRQVLEWTPAAIHAHSASLSARLAAWARQTTGWEVPRPAQHFVGVRPRRSSHASGEHDPRAWDWAERVERACRARGVHVAARFGWVRVAPHVYNDESDIDALIAVLAAEAELEADAEAYAYEVEGHVRAQLPRVLAGLSRFDAVGPVERFDELFYWLSERMGPHTLRYDKDNVLNATQRLEWIEQQMKVGSKSKERQYAEQLAQGYAVGPLVTELTQAQRRAVVASVQVDAQLYRYVQGMWEAKVRTMPATLQARMAAYAGRMRESRAY